MNGLKLAMVGSGMGPMGLHSASLPITAVPGGHGAIRHALDSSGSLPGQLQPIPTSSQVGFVGLAAVFSPFVGVLFWFCLLSCMSPLFPFLLASRHVQPSSATTTGAYLLTDGPLGLPAVRLPSFLLLALLCFLPSSHPACQPPFSAGPHMLARPLQGLAMYWQRLSVPWSAGRGTALSAAWMMELSPSWVRRSCPDSARSTMIHPRACHHAAVPKHLHWRATYCIELYKCIITVTF